MIKMPATPSTLTHGKNGYWGVLTPSQAKRVLQNQESGAYIFFKTDGGYYHIARTVHSVISARGLPVRGPPTLVEIDSIATESRHDYVNGKSTVAERYEYVYKDVGVFTSSLTRLADALERVWPARYRYTLEYDAAEMRRLARAQRPVDHR